VRTVINFYLLMKNFFTSLVVSLLITLAGILIYHNYSAKKVGIVDTNRLIAEYSGTKKAVAEFEQKSKVWKSNLDTLTVEFQDQIKKFEKDRLTMSEKEMMLSQELLRNKQNQIAQYQQVTERKIQEEDQGMTQKLYKYINQTVDTYGVKNNYQFILGAKGDGGVLYGTDAIDLTDELIEILNNIED
jgi:outer membrane protein